MKVNGETVIIIEALTKDVVLDHLKNQLPERILAEW